MHAQKGDYDKHKRNILVYLIAPAGWLDGWLAGIHLHA